MSKRLPGGGHHLHSGPGGSPFPPLGLAASGAANLARGPPNGSTSGSNEASDSAAAFHHGASHRHGRRDGGGAASQREGLPPAPSKVDTVAAQQCRLQDAYWSDDEEDLECPLCLEEIDLSDANFKPCPCGYQICRFCWHHIKQNLNGRCPACRRKYSDQAVEFKPMSQDEIKRLTHAKKQKEKEKKELENMNRKHLANMRVVQKNLVYVVGLSSKLAKEELIPTLRSNEYFGQYGRISKILISKRTTASKLVMGTSESNIGVYVTYHRKEDAARAIVAIDGSKGQDGKIMRASYGTTKYCTTYLRNLPCTNPACTYLHEPGEEADSFTKEDLSTLRHAARDLENKGAASKVSAAAAAASVASPSPAPSSALAALSSTSIASPAADEPSALPKTASWASGKPAGTPSTPTAIITGLPAAFKDSDMPPLSASRKASTPKVPTVKNNGGGASASIPTGPRAATKAAAAAAASTASAASTAAATVTSAATSAASNLVSAAVSDNNGSAASPAPPPPPGLTKTASSASLRSPKPTSAEEASPPTPSTPSQQPAQPPPSAPPGLARPPGLASTPTHSASYQPSASAQALLDDLRARREAEAERDQPAPSPFPDFDYTLSRFNDGSEFSFNFPGLPQAQAASSSSGALAAFVPLGVSKASLFGNGTTGDGADQAASSPSLGASSATTTPSYSGSFDPFSDSEITIGGVGASETPTTFKALDEMRGNLSDSRSSSDGSGTGTGTGAGQSTSSPSSSAPTASRFDFAKQQAREPSPLAAGAGSYGNNAEGGPLNLSSKDVSGILGGMFDHEVGHDGHDGMGGQHQHQQHYSHYSHQAHPAGLQHHAMPHRAPSRAATQAQAQAAQQAHVQRHAVPHSSLLGPQGGQQRWSQQGTPMATTPSSEPLLAQIMAAAGGVRRNAEQMPQQGHHFGGGPAPRGWHGQQAQQPQGGNGGGSSGGSGFRSAYPAMS
ncbi:hypothetical protein BDZ90DRAFT_164802 [Jaminaea rosea]|uniref:RING-type domain-containing protein n=1 Tax=Jaminaea rosea TaxID=1569628 RepID=A0A316UTQ6_9BASI|nr:hypothetical protein BDZ90DRAFT_164802 [Jaminaea rosea]PWN28188.1 hypothetical protein BDZ90DRAFT_164802 [Jaminaea rosea]